MNHLSVAHDGHCPKSHLHGWRAGRGAAHFASWVGMPGECLLQEDPRQSNFLTQQKPFVLIQVDLKKSYLCWATLPQSFAVATFCDLVFFFFFCSMSRCFCVFFHVTELSRINSPESTEFRIDATFLIQALRKKIKFYSKNSSTTKNTFCDENIQQL